MISINWATKVILVPKSYLTLITGTLYELDTNQFRKDLNSLQAAEEGIVFKSTHTHNTEVTVAGVTYARTIELFNGYSITFEDGQYTVILVGSNNNFFDVESGILNQNQVQVIPTNSVGLQVVVQGSGVTEQDKSDIVAGVIAGINVESQVGDALEDYDAPTKDDVGVVEAHISSHREVGEDRVAFLERVRRGRVELANNQLTIYDGSTGEILFQFIMFDKEGKPTTFDELY